MSGQAFGVIGLEVMGRNLALNVERNGYPIAVYNRTYAKTEHFINELAKGKNAKGAKTIDYDRQVPGGSASIYVSFDGHQVGVLQGSVGVVGGLKANGMYSKTPVQATTSGSWARRGSVCGGKSLFG